MEIFKEVFNKVSIYDMLFINVTAVLVSPSLTELDDEKKKLWFKIATDHSEKYYQENAINYPEFSRIVSIAYASVYHDTTMKRRLNKITGENEQLILETFFDVLNQLSITSKRTILTGDNIISYDIPFLIKRFLANLDKMIDKTLPVMLKDYLSNKPWDSLALDTRSIWNFNALTSSTNLSQYLYTDLLSLKKTVDVLTPAEISASYWENPLERLDFVTLQSTTKVNLVLQVMRLLRDI